MARANPFRAAASKTSAAEALGDAWTLRRISGLRILSAHIFDAFPWLVHAFSTRSAGAGRRKGERVLNLGFTEWDSRPAVAQNRGAFLRAAMHRNAHPKWRAKLPHAQSLITLRQMHSDVVCLVSEIPRQPPIGDAALSNRAGLFLAIQTADCVPILLADPRRRVVAAVHAGWRGTLARVAAKTLGRMRFEFGTRPQDVIAALGPAIGPCCYEVGPEVAQAFSAQFEHAADWFTGPFQRLATGEEPNPLPWLTMTAPGHPAPSERVWLDLRAANRWQLLDAGLQPGNMAVSELCTACRGDLFFSYRQEGAASGRMMAIIGVRQDAD